MLYLTDRDKAPPEVGGALSRYSRAGGASCAGLWTTNYVSSGFWHMVQKISGRNGLGRMTRPDSFR